MEAVLEDRVGLERMQISTDEVRKSLEELDVRKSAGLDGISNWMRKECNQQTAGKLSNLINASLLQGKVPMDWRQTSSQYIKEEVKKIHQTTGQGINQDVLREKKKWVKYLESNNILMSS